MMYNPNQYSYSQEWGGNAGFAYGQTPAEPIVQNLLSNEEIDELRQNTHQFNLALTAEEVKRNRCNHRDKNGRLATVPAGDGFKRCTVCGEVIKDVLYTDQEIEDLTGEVRNIFSVMKIIYPEIPRDIAEQYFMVPAILKRIPEIMKVATQNQDRNMNYNQYDANGGNSMFGFYDALSNNMFGAYANQYQNPAFQQQQFMNGNGMAGNGMGGNFPNANGGFNNGMMQGNGMQGQGMSNGFMGGSNGFVGNGGFNNGMMQGQANGMNQNQYSPANTDFVYGQQQQTQAPATDVKVTETLKA